MAPSRPPLPRRTAAYRPSDGARIRCLRHGRCGACGPCAWKNGDGISRLAPAGASSNRNIQRMQAPAPVSGRREPGIPGAVRCTAEDDKIRPYVGPWRSGQENFRRNCNRLSNPTSQRSANCRVGSRYRVPPSPIRTSAHSRHGMEGMSPVCPVSADPVSQTALAPDCRDFRNGPRATCQCRDFGHNWQAALRFRQSVPTRTRHGTGPPLHSGGPARQLPFHP